MPAIEEARPPYVRFDRRPVEDRNASIAAGRLVTKDVDFAKITPQGSKDTVERPVDEWFANMRENVQNGRFPERWLEGYERGYERWKKGEDMEVDGTSIKQWPVVSPSQVHELLAINILTVEDLARMNDEGVSRIGLGGLALRQRAQEWLKAANGVGKVAEELAALKARIANLEASLKASEDNRTLLNTENQQLRAKLGDAGAQTVVGKAA